VDRRKTGFAVPIEHWLRGSLRDWTESLLNEKTLRNDGYFNPKAIASWWTRFQAGDSELFSRLWIILMFQAWKEQWLN
jgi:asparagine synthase (glutamine-hydrolysing)